MAIALTETKSDSDSIELSRNAKGQYSFVVKLYGSDHKELLLELGRVNATLVCEYGKETEEK